MKPNTKTLFWLPRILCIVAILFISLFALDSFNPQIPLGRQILAFLIHMIPSFILCLVLITAWFWERLGGWLFIAIGTFTSPLLFRHNYNMNHSIAMSLGIIAAISLPFVVIGILFLLSHKFSQKEK